MEWASRVSCGRDSIEIDSALFILQASWVEAGRGGAVGSFHPLPINHTGLDARKKFCKEGSSCQKIPKRKKGRRHKQIFISVGGA